MRHLRRFVLLAVIVGLVGQFGSLRPARAKTKEIKVRGYITALTSPTSFQIEDYRITRDQSIRLEIDHPAADLTFKPEDLRVGTLVELRGQYNDETNELTADNIKVDLRQFRSLDVTTILDRKPDELTQADGNQWSGIVNADGRRIRIEPATQVLFRLNKTEQQQAAKAAKAPKPAPTPATESQADEGQGNDTTAAEQAVGATPLTSLADIGPGVIMTYEGREQPDGTVLTSKVVFVRNEQERAEKNLWKQLTVKEKPSNFVDGKPGELKVGSAKYKVLPNAEVQAYVNRVGQSLIPAYQRDLPEGDPNKIPFQFAVVIQKGFNAGAYPNGVVVINDENFQVLENEAQLAAVLAHEIAHATQEHGFRQMEHNKKRRTALAVASLFAAVAGYGGLSDMLDLINLAMVNGYGRTMENQADRLGLQYLVDAGYDPREAPRVWKLVTMKYGDSGGNFFWSNHDSNSERRSFQTLAIRNNFAGLDFGAMKRNETEYKQIAALAFAANPKNKKK